MNKQVEDSKAAFAELQNKLKSILDTLTPQEQEVLKMRFGLEDGYSVTLDEVGKHFGISREQIRHIEAKALRRLRHAERNDNEELMNILNSLTTKEQEIVKMKFGLETGIKATDDEILKKFQSDNLSIEELNKIIKKVNRRLEHTPDELSI